MISRNRRAELHRIIISPDLVQRRGEPIQLVLELRKVQLQQMGDIPQLLRRVRLYHERRRSVLLIVLEQASLGTCYV